MQRTTLKHGLRSDLSSARQSAEFLIGIAGRFS
jgi:hypothetical protein